MDQYNLIDTYLIKHLDESIEELGQLVAQPSVGAQNWGMQECAALVGQMLQKRGFTVEILPTGGAPVVIAERKGQVDKTLLFYNHYDVQPAEPLELWDTPPFEPAKRDGKFFGRGVGDDKGHITSRLFALDAILAEHGELPCNIKFIIEGEEETGSLHLPAFITANKEKLRADVCVWEGGGVDEREIQMMDLGLRGICYVELSVQTTDIDVHSGLGGSIFPNSAWRLVWALNTLKSPQEKILIPGWYDGIIPPTARDRELFELQPDMADEYKKQFGVKEFLNGLTGGVDLVMTEVFEPTCTICGLTSGYQGKGSKTILPAKASAKVDFRIVEGQTIDRCLTLLRKHLDEQGFSDIQIEFLGGGPAARTDPDHPFIKLVMDTAEEIYENKMELIPMIGGSGPNYPFVHELKLPVASAGLGHPDGRAHAPNENIRIDLYLKHARHMARLLNEYSQQP